MMADNKPLVFTPGRGGYLSTEQKSYKNKLDSIRKYMPEYDSTDRGSIDALYKKLYYMEKDPKYTTTTSKQVGSLGSSKMYIPTSKLDTSKIGTDLNNYFKDLRFKNSKKPTGTSEGTPTLPPVTPEKEKSQSGSPKSQLKKLDLSKYDLRNTADIKKMQVDLGFTGKDVDGIIGENTLTRLQKSKTINNYKRGGYTEGLKSYNAQLAPQTVTAATNGTDTAKSFADQEAFGNAYANALRPDATPEEIARVGNLGKKIGVDMSSADVIAARKYMTDPVQQAKTNSEYFGRDTSGNVIWSPNLEDFAPGEVSAAKIDGTVYAASPENTAPQSQSQSQSPGWFGGIKNWFTRERTPEEKQAMRQQVYDATGVDMGGQGGLAERFAY